MKKSFIAAAVLASAAFTAPGAWAQSDVSSTPQALELVDNCAFFGDSFEADNSGNTFADRFTFSVTGTVGQTLDAIAASVSRTADVGLTITSISLFDGNDTLLSQGSSIETGAVDAWSVAGGQPERGGLLPAGQWRHGIR